MVTDIICSLPNLPIKVPVTIGTMLNFDMEGEGDDVCMCKQTLSVRSV